MVFNLFKRKECPVCETYEKAISTQDELIKQQDKLLTEMGELYFKLCAITELISEGVLTKDGGLELVKKATIHCRPEVEKYKLEVKREMWEIINEA
ncbi:hypothetical protein K2634_002324 [Salmonella enterica subsp. enterica serovar Chester]|nr:hypothetical protein [Salmonella enterica subsp. enterica serovar Chester]ELX7030258.1 hypothetical protein [Salmonella enterica]